LFEESRFRAKVKAGEDQDRHPPGGFRLQGLGSRHISARVFLSNGIIRSKSNFAKSKGVGTGPWRKVGHLFL